MLFGRQSMAWLPLWPRRTDQPPDFDLKEYTPPRVVPGLVKPSLSSSSSKKKSKDSSRWFYYLLTVERATNRLALFCVNTSGLSGAGGGGDANGTGNGGGGGGGGKGEGRPRQIRVSLVCRAETAAYEIDSKYASPSDTHQLQVVGLISGGGDGGDEEEEEERCAVVQRFNENAALFIVTRKSITLIGRFSGLGRTGGSTPAYFVWR